MKKSELRKLIRESIEEAIVLKKYGDEIVAVSDLEDPKDQSRETFKNKNDLKRAGFRWDSSIGAWKVKADDFENAKRTAGRLNKDHPVIQKFEDLAEFVAGDKRISRSEELGKSIENYVSNLVKDVEDVRNSKEFMEMLAFNGKFHNYSLYNTLLIWLQKKDASKVAGYQTWKKKLHRQVVKGAKAIWIYVPMKFTEKEDEDQLSQKDLDNDVKRRSYTRFKLGRVFDISDTVAIDERGEVPAGLDWRGDSSPNEVADRLSGYVGELAENMDIEVTHDDAMGGEGGWSSGGKINITKDNAGIFKARTFIHEIAHELLHQKEKSIFHIEEPDRTIRELQADSVAYIVLKHYELPGESIANYLAGWSANKDRIMANLEILKKASQFIISETDKIAERDTSNRDG